MIISLENVTIYHDYSLILSKVSLSIHQGEWIVFKGPNGSGKSTLLKVMAGLLLPDEGKVHRTSYPLYYMGHKNAQQSHLTLVQDLAAKEKILTSYDKPSSYQMTTSDLIKKCHLSTFQHQKICDLSAGQQRQGALAALLFSPRGLWLLDEPFEHLDTNTKNYYIQICHQHIQRGGTICQTSHEDLPSALPIEYQWVSDRNLTRSSSLPLNKEIAS